MFFIRFFFFYFLFINIFWIGWGLLGKTFPMSFILLNFGFIVFNFGFLDILGSARNQIQFHIIICLYLRHRLIYIRLKNTKAAIDFWNFALTISSLYGSPLACYHQELTLVSVSSSPRMLVSTIQPTSIKDTCCDQKATSMFQPSQWTTISRPRVTGSFLPTRSKTMFIVDCGQWKLLKMVGVKAENKKKSLINLV